MTDIIPSNSRSFAQPDKGLRRMRLVGPPHQPLDSTVATDFLIAVLSLGSPIIFEIHVQEHALDFDMICDARYGEEILRAGQAAASTWEMFVAEPLNPPKGSLQLAYVMERPGVPLWAPLRAVDSFGESDPLNDVVGAVYPLHDDEELIFRYRVTGASPDRRARAAWDLTLPAPPEGLLGLLALLSGTGPRIPRFETSLQRALERRLNEPAYDAIGVIALTGSDPRRLGSLIRNLSAVYASRFAAGFGGIQLRPWNHRPGQDVALADGQDDDWLLYMTAGELATHIHLPSDRVLFPCVTRLRRPTAPLPLQVERASGLLLGIHHNRGRDVPVHLPLHDLEAGHAIVVGRTGVGKSTEIHQLGQQILRLPNRPGLCVIDPHHQLVRDIAVHSVPREREHDIALLELGNEDFPARLPFFWSPPGVPEEVVVQNNYSLMRLLFREQWSETRMADVAFALTATLCHLPGATLLDVPRLFHDPGFRRRALSGLDDPVTLEFWWDYEHLSEPAKREMVRPVLYRLRSLYRSKAVRNIVCQKSGLDFLEVRSRGTGLLISLAGPAIQAEADLLGEMIIARLHLAAMAQLARPRDQARTCYLVVDESHRFRGASLPILLREGRKLATPLILCTQYLDAWGEELAESVLGNVGTLVAFRSGPNDSRRLSASLRPFTSDQIEDLDRYEAVVKLQIDGTTMPAFDMRTLPITAPPDEAALERIRAHSRQRYARPRREVEEDLRDGFAASRANSAGGWERIDVDEE